jgi:hypothetical protein
MTPTDALFIQPSIQWKILPHVSDLRKVSQRGSGLSAAVCPKSEVVKLHTCNKGVTSLAVSFSFTAQNSFGAPDVRNVVTFVQTKGTAPVDESEI